MRETEQQGRRSSGESSIYLGPDGRWHGWVSLGVKPDGRRDRRHRTGATRAEVVAKVRALEESRAAGQVPDAGRIPTLAQWLDHWLDAIAGPRLRQSTIKGYRSKIRTLITPTIGHLRLDKLRPEHLERAYLDWTRAGQSAASVLQAHAIIRRALKVAMQRRRISANPAALVDSPSVVRDEVEPLSRDETRRLLEVAAGSRNAARWSVALALGLRQGEALGLTWRYVDLEAGTLRVRWALQRLTGKGLELVEVKSRTSRRTIALPRQLVDALRAHRAAQAAEKLAAGSSWRDGPHGGFVFAQRNGRPVAPERDWVLWKRLLGEAGVRDARLHDARHTAASLLLLQGVHARTVMQILGHSAYSFTMSTYGHVAPEMAEDAAARMGEALWAPLATKVATEAGTVTRLRAENR